MAPATKQQVTVLGSTGSIGVNTLDVIARHPDRFTVYALTAQRSVAALRDQCLVHAPRYAVMTEEAAAEELQRELASLRSEHPSKPLASPCTLLAVAVASMLFLKQNSLSTFS